MIVTTTHPVINTTSTSRVDKRRADNPTKKGCAKTHHTAREKSSTNRGREDEVVASKGTETKKKKRRK